MNKNQPPVGPDSTRWRRGSAGRSGSRFLAIATWARPRCSRCSIARPRAVGFPGLRLAAADTQSAEYLAEKIAQLESGQPMAGSLAETELKLRLYHGPARFDLIVKDYQGEHVTLGSEEPIQEFFAGCDAVLLCLDPEGSTEPAERRRRQQEVENLLERYIDRSDDLSMGRPVALLLTKFDRVLASSAARGDIAGASRRVLSAEFVERLVDERYGMTRHALAEHAPEGAIFAVSSFGPSASGNRPPTELRPHGTRGPAELGGRAARGPRSRRHEPALGTGPARLAPPGALRRAYERRYPRSNRSYEFRGRIKKLARHRRVRWADPRSGRRAAGVWACWPDPICSRSTGRRHSSEPATVPRPRSRGTGRSCSSGTPRCRRSGRPWPGRPG